MLDILYEDDSLLFVNKPPDIVVQRAHDPDEPVLFEIAERHASPLFLMQRLDRGTSGVMFFSKKDRVNRALTRFFEQRRIHKRYLALCEGEIAETQTIDAPLVRIGAIKFGVENSELSSRATSSRAGARDLGDGGREAVESPSPGNKRAVTHIDPIDSSPQGSLVSVHLETGRTHQIRVHLAAIGHPLVGDWLYGDRNAARPMLHSAELAMPHPVSGETLRVNAPPPSDFQREAELRGLVRVRGHVAPSGVQLNY